MAIKYIKAIFSDTLGSGHISCFPYNILPNNDDAIKEMCKQQIEKAFFSDVVIEKYEIL